MRYITLAPSFPNSSVVELKTVNFAVPRSNRGWGVGRTGNVRFFLIKT